MPAGPGHRRKVAPPADKTDTWPRCTARLPPTPCDRCTRSRLVMHAAKPNPRPNAKDSPPPRHPLATSARHTFRLARSFRSSNVQTHPRAAPAADRQDIDAKAFRIRANRAGAGPATSCNHAASPLKPPRQARHALTLRKTPDLVRILQKNHNRVHHPQPLIRKLLMNLCVPQPGLGHKKKSFSSPVFPLRSPAQPPPSPASAFPLLPPPAHWPSGVTANDTRWIPARRIKSRTANTVPCGVS